VWRLNARPINALRWSLAGRSRAREQPNAAKYQPNATERVEVSDKPKRKQGGKGRPWPKGVSENPSVKPSRLTKMGEEFMREDVQFRGARFCPWSQILLIVIFGVPTGGFVAPETLVFTML